MCSGAGLDMGDCLPAPGLSAEVQKASASFMVISGITGPDQCLAAVGESTAMLEPCTEAIAAGDGREVWAFEGGGKVRNVVNGKCLAVRGQCGSGGHGSAVSRGSG